MVLSLVAGLIAASLHGGFFFNLPNAPTAPAPVQVSPGTTHVGPEAPDVTGPETLIVQPVHASH